MRGSGVQPLPGDGESKAQPGPRWPLVLEDTGPSGPVLLHPRREEGPREVDWLASWVVEP